MDDVASDQENPCIDYLRHEYDRKMELQIIVMKHEVLRWLELEAKTPASYFEPWKILRRFASKIVNKLMKEKMIDRRLPKQTVNRVLLASYTNASKKNKENM